MIIPPRPRVKVFASTIPMRENAITRPVITLIRTKKTVILRKLLRASSGYISSIEMPNNVDVAWTKGMTEL